ncbi:MAG: hypothetical protein HOP37_00995 [Cyclobacteriaceae bacterium]|nr:hypothetical protein [Cyclobacteriaceae bacterium]
MAIKIGLIRSINEESVSSEVPNNYPTGSFGVYRYFNVNTKNESLFPFHYLKGELNFGYRAGRFAINNLNQTAVIQTNFVELALIVPLTWEITDHIAANVGLGAGLGLVRSTRASSDITPTPSIQGGDSFKGTFIADYHFLIVGSGNGVIGMRVLIEPSKYSYAEWSVYFGFSIPKSKKKVGKT